MNRQTFFAVPFSLVVALWLGGCGQKAASVANPAEIGAGDYDRVFDAAVMELRDWKFTLDRRDRRFGLVTTQPLTASSVFEPWNRDNSTGGQAVEATLNHHRRTVFVTLRPRGVEEGVTPEQEPAVYDLLVRVEIERRVNPPQALTTSALGGSSLTTTSRFERRQITETGAVSSAWRAMGRDERMEERLVRAILARSQESGVRSQESQGQSSSVTSK